MSNIRNITIESPVTGFNDVITAQKTLLIGLKSNYGISDLRDVVYEDGSRLSSARGSTLVTNANGEYALSLPATSSKSLRFESAEWGRYQAGFVGQTGLGVRFASATRTGNQIARWGYFLHNSNGFYFKLTSTGLFITICNSGTETNIARSSWNGDKLDGTGPSGLTLDLTDGNIFQIDYIYYGYGPIKFFIFVQDVNNNNKYTQILVHEYKPTQSISIAEPNLPISVQMENGATAASQVVYVGGRQYSIIGNYTPVKRVTGESVNASLTTTFSPIISFKKKSSFDSVRTLVFGYTILTKTNDVQIKVLLNTTLTGASFGNLQNIPAAETALEFDSSATSYSGGVQQQSKLHASGTGRSAIAASVNIGSVTLPANQNLTIIGKSLSSTATVDIDFELIEEW